jgi:hypothetical protein
MKIFVISHKLIDVTLCHPFIPLYVGPAASSISGISDCSGDSISSKNSFYSELTGQYWVWKNLLPNIDSDEIVGFCHYRRFFNFGQTINTLDDVCKVDHSNNIATILKSQGDVILPTEATFPLKQHWFSRSKALKKLKFPWESLTLLEQFELEHDKQSLLTAINLLPNEHKQEFINYLHGHKMSPYNMYITTPNILDTYFNTLFSWLFEAEKFIEYENKSAYQARLPGFISERFASYFFNKFHNPVLTPVSFIR